MTTIFLNSIYCVSFFALGLIVLVIPKKDSRYTMAPHFVLFGAFALTHGFVEVIDLIITAFKTTPAIIQTLEWYRFIALPVSFFFLAQFGVNLLIKKEKKFHIIGFIPLILLILWALLTGLSQDRLLMGDSLARLLLALPGAVLAAFALLIQKHECPTCQKTINDHLTLSSFVLFLYAISAGLFTTKAGFFPSSILNYDLFINNAGFPIQWLRALCALALAYSMLRVLSIFEWETKHQIRSMNKRLESQNDELDKLNKIKSKFVDNVSHEFKNPLFILKENITLFTDGTLGDINEKQKTALEKCQKQIERMLRLATDLLDSSKIEKDKFKLTRKKVNIEKITQDIASGFASMAKSKNIYFEQAYFENTGEAWGDEDKLTQVFMNLISNAIKYTPQDGMISLKVYGDLENVTVEIKNSGPGLSKEEADKIFDKFERVTEEKQEGTGLGLPIAKDIINLHKGSLTLKTKPDDGCLFTVILPRDLRKFKRY